MQLHVHVLGMVDLQGILQVCMLYLEYLVNATQVDFSLGIKLVDVANFSIQQIQGKADNLDGKHKTQILQFIEDYIEDQYNNVYYISFPYLHFEYLYMYIDLAQQKPILM